MSRRSTPDRLSDARRAALVNRLIGAGELPTRAEAMVGAWERATASDDRPHDGAYWEEAHRWIVDQATRPPFRTA
ncbi:MAG: hypothetical protein H0V73_01825 [Chloroflexi bacterium]|nr:hypothetical protein [Chloroflexota bacterium]